jgi:predicted nucleic acid-binding protein
MAVVVDASALAFALLSNSASARELRRRLAGEDCHAPHLIDAEIGNVLRQRVLRGELVASAAEELLGAAGPLIDYRYQMTGRLARAAWARHLNLTFYDALYAALAATLSIPLLTADRRLAHAPGIGCSVEQVSRG